jgi:uncharacterized protein (DUF488 family)
MSTALYTVGYEGRSLDEVLKALEGAKVRRLVDVRELPLSRRRGFSKTALSEALAAVGIEYVHVRPLGNPKENRDRYRAGDVEGGAEVFRRRLANGSRSALLELAASVGEDAACLMCFERDHAVCHRSVIVDAVRELRPELSIRHL